MNLTEEEKDDLAAVLSEHLVGFPVRRATAEGAGMIETDVGGEPTQQWRLLIGRAMEKGKLIALLKSAAAHSPGDPVLDRLVEGAERGMLVLPEAAPPSPPWRALAIGAVGAVLIVVMAILGVRFVDYVQGWVPAPKVTAPPPGDPLPPGEVPALEVRTGLQPPPKPAPAPAHAPAPPAPEEPVETVEPHSPPGRFIKIPDPSEPAPAPAPPP